MVEARWVLGRATCAATRDDTGGEKAYVNGDEATNAKKRDSRDGLVILMPSNRERERELVRQLRSARSGCVRKGSAKVVKCVIVDCGCVVNKNGL